MAGGRRAAKAKAGTTVVDLGSAVPAHLAARISPFVLQARAARIAVRLEDAARERVLRRRCAEVIAETLINQPDE